MSREMTAVQAGVFFLALGIFAGLGAGHMLWGETDPSTHIFCASCDPWQPVCWRMSDPIIHGDKQ